MTLLAPVAAKQRDAVASFGSLLVVKIKDGSWTIICRRGNFVRRECGDQKDRRLSDTLILGIAGEHETIAPHNTNCDSHPEFCLGGVSRGALAHSVFWHDVAKPGRRCFGGACRCVADSGSRRSWPFLAEGRLVTFCDVHLHDWIGRDLRVCPRVAGRSPLWGQSRTRDVCEPLATIQQPSHRILARIRLVWRRLTIPNKVR